MAIQPDSSVGGRDTVHRGQALDLEYLSDRDQLEAPGSLFDLPFVQTRLTPEDTTSLLVGPIISARTRRTHPDHAFGHSRFDPHPQ